MPPPDGPEGIGFSPSSGPDQPERSAALLEAAFTMAAASGGRLVLVVSGSSMKPSLDDGDAVLVEPAPSGIACGDVVIVADGRAGLVVHRHVGASRPAGSAAPLLCRGDGRMDLDPPFAAATLRGRAVALRRAGSWWSLERPAARAWARAVALHDRFWARIAGAVRRPALLRRLAGACDRRFLRLVDAALFRAVHARIEPPGEGDGARWYTARTGQTT